MRDAFIYDHVRTPRGRGKSDGALHEITPIALGTQMLEALRDRSNLDTRQVADVVFGIVSPVGEQGGNLPRAAVLQAGYDLAVPAQQLNRFCASGLEAVNHAATLVMSGQADAVIGGGVESMSRVAMGSDGAALSTDPAVAYRTYFVPQGIGADLIATLEGFTRAQVDGYAVESHRRAAAAWGESRFARSVVPVHDVIGQTVLERDEHIRAGTTLEDLAALKPSFAALGERGGFDAVAIQRYPQVESIHHLHHAGNSSGIVDGAAAVLVGGRRLGARIGRRPRARIRAFTSIGTEPTIMLTGPVEVTRRLLKRARMSVTDVDLFEVNEAFAAVVLHFMKHLGVPHEKVNVNGGAIAMGHPLGATGAMILGTALDELERRDLNIALITLCVGAGMGTATLIERV